LVNFPRFGALFQEKSGNPAPHPNSNIWIARVLQGCQIFWHNIPKQWKIYQIITTLPKYHKTYKMALKYSIWTETFSILRPLKVYLYWDFWFKIYHLATLSQNLEHAEKIIFEVFINAEWINCVNSWIEKFKKWCF
jgi:hypothetical protein